ncbi:DUF983 domain-containing protein [Phreatobacter stygius]|uniref:DUF983 domain-containing protein n=1 Tax=Phreatobacter stygius TaxID=1940610 RepID=A0A4D7BHI0_9HYPH|nr:DUF983 domain-containing protein [Phreatobacter stygius]QCI68586.1 DUF983 domain-containing protein [Phreatobacter stygius]
MTVQILHGAPVAEARPDRNLWTALKRGLLCRCPNCGKGRMFSSYLKVAPACDHCGEALHHHRADDAPPYLTIMVVGHIIVPLLMWMELRYQPELWIHFILWLPLTLALCLGLLPPIKGLVVALQWALRMHGFDPDSPEAKEQASV